MIKKTLMKMWLYLVSSFTFGTTFAAFISGLRVECILFLALGSVLLGLAGLYD